MNPAKIVIAFVEWTEKSIGTEYRDIEDLKAGDVWVVIELRNGGIELIKSSSVKTISLSEEER